MRLTTSFVALVAFTSLAACAGSTTFQARDPVPNPDESRFVTEDIPRFWAAFDSAIDGTDEELAHALQTMYLDPATPGVEGFTAHRIRSAEHLAKTVRARRADYEAARANSLAVMDQEPAIRAAFHKFKEIYPDAVFPDAYFVIGAFNSGGTSQPMGIIMGMEMDINQPATIPFIVAHEAVHYQQQFRGERTLIDQVMIEGCADYIGLLASGGTINQRALDYARAHTRELWRDMRDHLDDNQFGTWLYVHDADKLAGRPPDLGYAMGCLIAEAYHQRAADKAKAIAEITECRDPRELLEKSGFAEMWK